MKWFTKYQCQQNDFAQIRIIESDNVQKAEELYCPYCRQDLKRIFVHPMDTSENVFFIMASMIEIWSDRQMTPNEAFILGQLVSGYGELCAKEAIEKSESKST